MSKLCQNTQNEIDETHNKLKEVKKKLELTENYTVELNVVKYNWKDQKREMEENISILTHKTKHFIDLIHRTCEERDAIKSELNDLTEASKKLRSNKELNEKILGKRNFR